VDARFKDSFADGFAITEVPMLGGTDTVNDAGAAHFVSLGCEPGIEFFRAVEDVHAAQRIRTDTALQSEKPPSSHAAVSR
jgi:hypothetical protein